MRKIILNLAMSLDGYIEGPNGEYDWCFADQDYGMEEFTNNTDAIFIGRKSYELIAAEPEMFGPKKLYVFSDTLQQPGGNVEVIRSADFVEAIERIRHEEGLNIWLFGGASLVSKFIEHDLINEMMLSVHPVILGAGKPLFQDIKERTELTLIKHIPYDTGLVQLYYTTKPKFDLSMLDIDPDF